MREFVYADENRYCSKNFSERLYHLCKTFYTLCKTLFHSKNPIFTAMSRSCLNGILITVSSIYSPAFGAFARASCSNDKGAWSKERTIHSACRAYLPQLSLVFNKNKKADCYPESVIQNNFFKRNSNYAAAQYNGNFFAAECLLRFHRRSLAQPTPPAIRSV